jgi:hypothetical protein
MEIKRYLLSICRVNVCQVNGGRWGDDFSPSASGEIVAPDILAEPLPHYRQVYRDEV